MNHFFKVFIITFLCFTLMFIAGFYTYSKVIETQDVATEDIDKEKEDTKDNLGVSEEDSNDNKDSDGDVNLDPLQKEFNESNRVNFLLFGLEKKLKSDVMMFVSIDIEEKLVDIISIPNNTYYYEKGYDLGEQRYLSNIYYSKGREESIKVIKKMLGDVPIHYHAAIDYNDVENIIDSIGGVEVDVPFDMKYEDISQNPPLFIDIKKGRQILDGKESLKYLRWKNNNDYTVGYGDGDLGRVKAQQKFIFSAIKKSLNFNFPSIVNRTIKSIDTNFSKTDAINYTVKLMGIKIENFNIHVLPGGLETKEVDGKIVSYFINDEEKSLKLIKEVYNIK